MSKQHEFTQIHAYGEVTNDDASLELVTAAQVAGDHYLYIEKLHLSVYEPAIGSGGIVRVRDTLGNPVCTINVDGVKDFSLDFGEYGLRLANANVGLQVVVSGGQTKQASVSVILKAHIDNR